MLIGANKQCHSIVYILLHKPLPSYEKRVLYTEQILDGMEYTIQKIEVCIELSYLDFPPDDRRDPKLLVYINFIY